jgi:RNA polymerase sigma factor (sigma-70 family)
MAHFTPTSDAVLLARADTEPEAFAVFYRRHLPLVLGFVLRRVGDRELAADITAEVFAAALASRRSFDPDRGNARGWLCTIASHKIIDTVRRGRVEDEARRRLEMEPVVLDDRDLERVELIAAESHELDAVESMLSGLEPETRAAVEQRVLLERDYSEIAAELRCSESVVRKRVSRGLSRIRKQLMEAK